MLNRFKVLVNPIKKAVLDNKKIAKLVGFLDNEAKRMLDYILNLLKPFYDSTISLIYLKNESEDLTFYSEPTDEKIVEIYLNFKNKIVK